MITSIKKEKTHNIVKQINSLRINIINYFLYLHKWLIIFLLVSGDFIKCGGSQLVHRAFWCDGWPECTDNHADELSCNYLNTPNMLIQFFLNLL